jgi:hypothetical protein
MPASLRHSTNDSPDGPWYLVGIFRRLPGDQSVTGGRGRGDGLWPAHRRGGGAGRIRTLAVKPAPAFSLSRFLALCDHRAESEVLDSCVNALGAKRRVLCGGLVGARSGRLQRRVKVLGAIVGGKRLVQKAGKCELGFAQRAYDFLLFQPSRFSTVFFHTVFFQVFFQP